MVDQDTRFMSDITLPQNSLGRTGLSVTKLGYGAMEVRGPRIWGGRPIEDAEAEQILNSAVDESQLVSYLGFDSTAGRGRRSLPLPPVASWRPFSCVPHPDRYARQCTHP